MTRTELTIGELCLDRTYKGPPGNQGGQQAGSSTGPSGNRSDQRPAGPGNSPGQRSDQGRAPGSSTGSTSQSSGYKPGGGYQGTNPRPPGQGYQGSNPRSAGTGGGYPSRTSNAGGPAAATPDYSQGQPAPAPAGTGAPRPNNFSGAPRPGGGFGGPRPGGFQGARPGGFSGPRPPRPAQSPREAYQKEKDKDALRINAEISVPEVRLVGADGEMVGVVSIKEAITAAEEAGLDLVEVSPQAAPPVCKILDYGKYRYAEQKKKAEARKKQKIVEIKEVKLRPAIDEHDFQIKMAMSKRFLEEGDKVKITLRFRGRELGNLSLGDQLLEKVKIELENLAKVEQRTGMEGRQMIMILAPLK